MAKLQGRIQTFTFLSEIKEASSQQRILICSGPNIKHSNFLCTLLFDLLSKCASDFHSLHQSWKRNLRCWDDFLPHVSVYLSLEYCRPFLLHNPQWRNNGLNDSFSLHLVSVGAPIKSWPEEERSLLKRRKCLPRFASIIQQLNSPLGNSASSKTFLNESKSQCVFWPPSK